jgi:hypothetical protein
MRHSWSPVEAKKGTDQDSVLDSAYQTSSMRRRIPRFRRIRIGTKTKAAATRLAARPGSLIILMGQGAGPVLGRYHNALAPFGAKKTSGRLRRVESLQERRRSGVLAHKPLVILANALLDGPSAEC